MMYVVFKQKICELIYYNRESNNVIIKYNNKDKIT
jgi:hypothetical protein